MKTAVILSGQLRNFEECFPSFKLHILDHNECHIYMQTYASTPSAEVQRAIELYQPRRLLLENPDKDFEICGRCEPKAEAMYWMWRNVQVAFQLVPPTKYDCIVKARYDLQYSQPIKFADYDMNNINIPDGANFLGGIGDLFMFSCYTHTEYYCTMFDVISHYVMVDNITCHPETLLRHHLRDKPLFRPDFPLYLRGIRMTDYKS